MMLTWLSTIGGAIGWLFRLLVKDHEQDAESRKQDRDGRDRDNQNWKEVSEVKNQMLLTVQHQLDVILPAKLAAVEAKLDRKEAEAFDLRNKLQMAHDENIELRYRLRAIEEFRADMTQPELPRLEDKSNGQSSSS